MKGRTHVPIDCLGRAATLIEEHPKSAKILLYIHRQSDTATLDEIMQAVAGAKKEDATCLLEQEFAYRDGAGYRLNKNGKCVAEYLRKHKSSAGH